MAQTTYQVTLSATGRHIVSVTSDDTAALEAGLAWAKAMREQLMASKSAKPEPQPEGEEVSGEKEAPICPVHNQPMKWIKGSRGWFWNCSQYSPEEGYCSYKYRPNGK